VPISAVSGTGTPGYFVKVWSLPIATENSYIGHSIVADDGTWSARLVNPITQATTLVASIASTPRGDVEAISPNIHITAAPAPSQQQSALLQIKAARRARHSRKQAAALRQQRLQAEQS
jgi:hypothetical protein